MAMPGAHITPTKSWAVVLLWSKRDKLSSSDECRIRTFEVRYTKSPADWMPTHKPTELSRIKLKTWTQQSVSMMSEHIYIHTYVLVLIYMLWHRQAIFESKGDKLSSSAECRIRTQGLRHQIASRLNARWQTDWAIEDQAKTWNRQPVRMISEHSAHSTPLPVGSWLWRYNARWPNFVIP